jgi:hypothetical protein
MSTPQHISYSAITTYTHCGEQYRLSRILRVPEAPAWYFWGGSAVHTATEQWDLGHTDIPLDTMFRDAFHKEIESDGCDVNDLPDNIRAGGRKPETYDWWMDNGPAMIQRWIDWREATGWAIWQDPDTGAPGVELALKPTVNGTEVKAYLDRLFVDGAGQLIVVDLKCGSRTPASALQLGMYADLVQRVYGVLPTLGGYFMARQSDPDKQLVIQGLGLYDSSHIERYVDGFMNARHSGAYLPNVTAMCKACSVAQHCWAVGGTDPSQSAVSV